MKLSLNNFLYGVKQIVMGGGTDSSGTPYNDAGYLVDRVVDGATSLAAGAGGNTNPYIAYIHRDYDEATDVASINLFAEMAGATDTPAVTATVVRKRAGVADATLANATALGSLSNSIQKFTINLDGNTLLRDDVLYITFNIGSHTTDAVTLLCVTNVYRSCLVSYNEEDSSGNALR